MGSKNTPQAHPEDREFVGALDEAPQLLEKTCKKLHKQIGRVLGVKPRKAKKLVRAFKLALLFTDASESP